MRLAGIASLLVCAALCGNTIAEGLDESPLLDGLPPCDLPSASAAPPNWQRMLAPGGDIEFRAPSDLVIDPQPGNLSWHGGATWESPGTRIVLQYGYWSQHSFEASNITNACRTKTDGFPAMVMRIQDDAAISVAVWFITPGSAHEPVLTIQSDDPELAWRLIFSVAATSSSKEKE